MFGVRKKQEVSELIRIKNQHESDFAKLLQEIEKLKASAYEQEQKQNRLLRRFQNIKLLLLVMVLGNILIGLNELGVMNAIMQNWNQLEPIVWLVPFLFGILQYALKYLF